MISGDIPHSPDETVFGPAYSEQYAADFEAMYLEAYDGMLRPYDDDDFLLSRLTAQNRTLRRVPELNEVISGTLLADDDASLLQAVDKIAEARRQFKPANEVPIAAVLSYATLAVAVLEEKDETVGWQAPNDRSNALAILLGRQLCQDIPDEQVGAYLASTAYLSSRFDKLDSNSDGKGIHAENIKAKLTQLSSMLVGRYNAIKYADIYPGGTNVELVSPTQESMLMDSHEVQAYFTDIRATQDTGLKLAYKPHPLGGSLTYTQPFALAVIREYHEKSPHVHALTLDSSAVAEVLHSGQQTPDKLKPKPIEMAQGIGGVTYDGLDLHASMFIDGTGELYADLYCTIPLRDTFARQGKYSAYREMQAGILADYFDMTHAVKVVNAAKIDIDAVQVSSDEMAPAEPMEVIRNMLVPRIRRVMDQPAEDGESAVEKIDEVDTNRRSVRLHGVTWFRRSLPEGWSASPQARALATTVGIELEEGETFVRAHNRGSKAVGEVIGHKIVDRQ